MMHGSPGAGQWCPLTDYPNDKDTGDAPGVPPFVSEITGIDLYQLHNFTPGTHQIRQVMVWASKRETTRIEDIAYRLIGVLDIP